MHADTFIQKIFGNVIHKSRVKVLCQIVNNVILTKTLNLTKLGRALDPTKQERSGIRKVDRFLANKFFQQNSDQFYQGIIDTVVGNKQRPWLIVDWTKLPNTEHYGLRVALAADGRAITLYEEVHPKKKEGNRAVQTAFLRQLKAMLPEVCRPIIVTDAGFKNPWFKEIENLGWDYLGRARGSVTYADESGIGFEPIKNLFKSARVAPQYLGKKLLAKKNPLLTSFYLMKEELKGRKKRNKNGKIAADKDSKNYSKSRREPWLLVSSLSGRNAAKKIKKIYRMRMTIEEGLRDMKSSRYGFSMENNLTIREERLIVWLMLSALASLYAWIVGYVAESLELHRQFQANSIRNRRVLSFFYLGCQVIRKNLKIPIVLSKIRFMDEEALI